MGRNLAQSRQEDETEFIKFMIANFDYNHEFFRLQMDLSKKLKREELRAAFFKSAQDFNVQQRQLVSQRTLDLDMFDSKSTLSHLSPRQK